MNKTISNLIFYLCISFFAFQCGGSETPEISAFQEQTEAKKELSDSEKYVENLKTSENAENDIPDLGLNKENILITDIQYDLFDVKKELEKMRSKLTGLQREVDKQAEFNPSELWSSPFSIYNQEILLQNGTIMYGNIVYQDTEIITLETLIGKININRPQVVRIVSHHPDVPEEEALAEWAEPEIESGNELYQKPAEVILYGSMFSSTDNDGNQTLNGNVKNIGGKRADYVKINITLFRDWSASLPPKTYTVFVDGQTQFLNPADSSLVSHNSLDPKSIAPFELVVPKSFGTVMSWTYEIDYEEYEK